MPWVKQLAFEPLFHIKKVQVKRSICTLHHSKIWHSKESCLRYHMVAQTAFLWLFPPLHLFINTHPLILSLSLISSSISHLSNSISFSPCVKFFYNYHLLFYLHKKEYFLCLYTQMVENLKGHKGSRLKVRRDQFKYKEVSGIMCQRRRLVPNWSFNLIKPLQVSLIDFQLFEIVAHILLLK